MDHTRAPHRAGAHRAEEPGSAARGCTRPARRPAAPTSSKAGSDREATFLIGGDQCTRRCDFAVDRHRKARRAGPTSHAESLPTAHDGLLCHCHRRGSRRPPGRRPGCTPRPCAPSRTLNPSTGVEPLIPDFNGEPARLAESLSGPEVLAHNAETVPRIFFSDPPAFALAQPGCAWPLRATPAWSPRHNSSSAWAKPLRTRCGTALGDLATPAATSLLSPNT